MSILVSKIQKHNFQDGEGIRTVVFLKGCYLKCPWCCNPETISFQKDIFFYENKCLKSKRIKSDFCGNCQGEYEKNPNHTCLFGAFESTEKKYTADELFEEIIVDKSLFNISGGGVTFSGGDPLIQARELLPVLKKLKLENVSIGFETSLYVPPLDQKILEYIDFCIIDLKVHTAKPFLQLSSDEDINNWFNYNFQLLNRSENLKIVYRFVLIDDFLNSGEKISAVINRIKLLGIDKIELLSCHSLAITKYKQLGINFKSFSPPTKDHIQQFIEGLQFCEKSLTIL